MLLAWLYFSVRFVKPQDTRKVQLTVTLPGMQLEQVARQRTHGNGRLVGYGIVKCQPQVLGHQIDQEAALILPRCRHAFHHARPRVVHVQRPVAARALFHDFRQHRRVQAVLHTQGQGFAGTGHQDGQHHVVADLGHLPSAVGAGVEDVLAHGFFFSSRRRHTSCGRDWSSDVCSSDLSASYCALISFINSCTPLLTCTALASDCFSTCRTNAFFWFTRAILSTSFWVSCTSAISDRKSVV